MAQDGEDISAQNAKVLQLIANNRALLRDYPAGDVQLKSLVNALCEQVELALADGEGTRVTAEVAEIENLLAQIEGNPAIAAWATPFRERPERIRQSLIE